MENSERNTVLPLAAAPCRKFLVFLLYLLLPSCAGISVCIAGEAAATTPPNLQNRDPLFGAPEKIRALIEQTLPTLARQFQTPDSLHSEITLGQFSSALQLAACSQIEAFLPPTGIPWGKIQVGVRCKQAGVKWQVFLPVMVKISGPALVATRPLSTGEALSPEDLQFATIELSQYPLAQARQLPAQAEPLYTQLMARPLPAGQPIRLDYVRPRPVLAAGDQVRVLMTGQGFAVASQGKALNPAGTGQAVRVQIENGRILIGVARANHQVEVAL